jgi:hypothetical protein
MLCGYEWNWKIVEDKSQPSELHLPNHGPTLLVYTLAVITISPEQRDAIAIEGTPLPVIDRESGHAYVLLSVHLSPAPLDGVRAEIHGISAIGEGDTPEEAIIALREALVAQIQAFGQGR